MSLLTQGQSLGEAKYRGSERGWSLAGACGRGDVKWPQPKPQWASFTHSTKHTPCFNTNGTFGCTEARIFFFFFIFDNRSKAHYS